MKKTDFLASIKAIQGKPITLLLYLRVIGGRAGEQELSEISGWSLPPIRAALKTLHRFGWVSRVSYHGGWQLAELGFQLALAFPEIDEIDEPERNLHVAAYGSYSLDTVNALLLNLISLTITTIGKQHERNLQVDACVDYLVSMGVWRTRAKSVAKAAKNDLALIQAHFDLAEGINPALVCHRITEGIPPHQAAHMTFIRANQHSKDCHCAACLELEIDYLQAKLDIEYLKDGGKY